MARASQRQEDEELTLIEEQVDTGLAQVLEGYRTSYIPGGDKPDDLLSRFTLYPSRALPDLDNAYAKAYEARDDFNPNRQIYGLVCDDTMPVRHQAIHELTAFNHLHLVSLLGSGTVRCSHLGESRQVLFFDMPRGTRMSEVMKTQPRLHEHKVIDHVLEPAVKALVAMREKKISHGHIHPANFYVSDSPQLGECYSSPCSSQTHYLYEPLERLMADPLGRGEATEKSDVYALAIFAFELMYGLDKMRALSKEAFIDRVINYGSYQIFSTNRDFSDAFQDFFRGILNDNPAERWGLDQLVQWINGKRFNMIAPTAPKDASRPILFANEDFFSRKMLAHAFHTHWREAIKEVKNLKLDRWSEMSLHRAELAEKLDRAMRFAGLGSTDTQMNEMLSRVIMLLDPVGPIRSRHFSLRPDAIGTVLADLMRQTEAEELPELLTFIENDYGGYWTEQAEINKLGDMPNIIWKLQRAKPHLKNKSMGFGLERVLYDLNPSLACQSPILKPYHVTSALEALKTLDAIAPSIAHTTSFADHHIAAFIGSKIEMNKEIRLHDIEMMPQLANHPELVVMRILAKAQQRTSRLQLIGLCTWAAMRIELMIDEIHNRIIRKRLKLSLKKLALTGDLYEVMSAIVAPNILNGDLDGFTKAIALHQINFDRIERLENQDIIEYKSKKSGGKIAMNISFFALAITTYICLSDALGI